MLRRQLLLSKLIDEQTIKTIAEYASDYKFAIFTDIDKLINTFGADELFKYYRKAPDFNLKSRFFYVFVKNQLICSSDDFMSLRNVILNDRVLAYSYLGDPDKIAEDMDRFDEFIMDELGE